MKRAVRLIFALLLLAAIPAGAQPRVSLLTAEPGADIYQLEGHTALRLTRPGDYDIAVNWGVFDFNAPNFVYRFVKGETDYMCAAYPARLFFEEYAREGRGVTEQVLDLTPAQAARVEELVWENLRPENRTYRYNYVLDNCATRPLAIVEKALGDTLSLVPPAEFVYGETGLSEADYADGKPETFRREMTRYHRDYPWYQFGIDLALGAGIDRPVSARERGFSPVYLRELLRDATLPADSAGTRRPAVHSEWRILEGNPEGVCADPTPWPLTPLAVAAYILAAAVIVSVRDIRRRSLSRWFDALLFGVYGLLGCLLTFLIFVSSHEATSPNFLYLWLNPLCLFAAVGTWIKCCQRAVYCYHFCNFAAVLLLLAAHRYFGQALNPAFPLLMTADLIRSATNIYITRAKR